MHPPATVMSGYFTRPFLAHITAVATIAFLYFKGGDFLAGDSAITMLLVVQGVALALHACAWKRSAKLSVGARSILVLLGLFGPLYSFVVLALYIFNASESPLVRVIPALMVGACLILMWLSLKPFGEYVPTDKK